MSMSILKRLMQKRGYKTIKVERTQCYMRKVYYESYFKSPLTGERENVTVTIDERKLDGISDVVELEYIYNDAIKEALEK